MGALGAAGDDAGLAPAAGVRHQRVREAMVALVGLGIRGRGRPQQAQAERVAEGAVAVLGVVEQRHAVAVLGEVGPARGVAELGREYEASEDQ